MLYELMLKAGYLLTDKVEKIENFYSINSGELLIAIESINQALTTLKDLWHKEFRLIQEEIEKLNNEQPKDAEGNVAKNHFKICKEVVYKQVSSVKDLTA